jgi:hypothetical protein
MIPRAATRTGVRRRAESYYQQFDALSSLRRQVRRDLLAEGGKHSAWESLRQIPFLGPIRAALILAILQTPHRFRTKRQLWTYIGIGIETHSSVSLFAGYWWESASEVSGGKGKARFLSKWREITTSTNTSKSKRSLIDHYLEGACCSCFFLLPKISMSC